MAKQIYQLILDDYSAPAFVSLYKEYYGTLDDISDFIAALRNDEYFAKHNAELISCFEKFKQGEKNIMLMSAYSKHPFLKRAKKLGEASSEFNNYKWEHINTWGFPYYMKCDEVKCSHLWLCCTGIYVRVINAIFLNLQYENILGEYMNPGMCWGFPHQIETDEEKTYSRLYVVEKTFNDKTETLLDMEKFNKGSKPDFTKLLDDVFGNG